MHVLTTIGAKLSKLIPLLASDKDGEVVATARAIGRALKQAGADWHDLTAVLTRSDPYDAIVPMCWRDIPESERAAWLDRMAISQRLSPWEREFTASIQAQLRAPKTLSPKQIANLDRIIRKLVWEAC